MEAEVHWYAVKAYWNRVERAKDLFDRRGIEYYAQSILPSYLFIHTDADTADSLRHEEWRILHIFTRKVKSESGVLMVPAPIPEKEMETFRLVTAAGAGGLQFLGSDPAVYQQGDKVRVTDGPFKGAEGYIKRIKKDRRLVVTISGVAAIATSFIPPQLLEKIENND